MVVKHQNPTQNGRIACAPYNFVPLPEKIVTICEPPDQDRYHDLNTGFVDCKLVTETPLYTRCALTPTQFAAEEEMAEDERKWMQADFFHIDDLETPVIPGSSLRGMVRSLVEIISFSKVQWVTKERFSYRGMADVQSLRQYYGHMLSPQKVRAGYIYQKQHAWVIVPAGPLGGAPFARIRDALVKSAALKQNAWRGCRNAWSIYIEKPSSGDGSAPLITLAQPSPGPHLDEAVLVETGPMQGKKKSFVFGPPSSDPGYLIADELIRSYLAQLTQAQRDLLGNQNGVLRDGQPVFYIADDNNKLVFFGHCMMFRLLYTNSPLDLVPEELRCERDLDMAEAIFGYTKGSDIEYGKSRAYAGRVFFTDARLEGLGGDVWLTEEPVVPRILGSPKPTTFQHYLTQQEPDHKDRLDHYDSPPPHPTSIRGHKQYWHKRDLQPYDFIEYEKPLPAVLKDTQHTLMKPVKPGVTFRFKVFFENLRNEELGALLWALVLPAGDNYRHKLGMGKPLGLGSVRIEPRLVLSSRKDRYAHLFDGGGWYEACQEASADQFISAFEGFVLNQVDKGKRRLAELERIQMLLKMLEYPGPPKEWTRYLEIERPDPTSSKGKRNEYRYRPVLPDPLNIKAPSTQVSAPPAKNSKSSRGIGGRGHQ